MSSFWERVDGHLGQGRRVFVACVAEHARGSPGTAGAKLAIAESGDRFGTIGGGAMEHRLVEQARAALRDGAVHAGKRTLVHSDTAAGERSGLVCEGSQTNVFCVLAGDRDRASVRTIVDRRRHDRPAWIAIDEAGLRLVDRPLDFDAPHVTLTEEDEAWQYLEDLLDRRRLAVIGGGHCALALAEVTARLGYRVRLFDTRTEVVTHDRAAAFADVSHVTDYAAVGPRIAYPELTAVVVMTADYRTDARALLGVLNLPLPFIGLMGGRKKIDRIFSLLQEDGIARQALARVHAPVGLPIGSETPEEIAVSVAAQLLRERNRR